MNSNGPSTPWAALPVLLAGAVMVVLDFFIVNVALPSIATDLGAGESSLEWVVAGYGLTFAAFLIVAGRLGDDLGRRRVYAVGLALFTVASAACGLAPSPTTLVFARVAQGVAGAVVMPQVLAIAGVTYRGPDYVRAMSLYGLALGLAAVGGQVIGGALVELDVAGLGWRSCFLINVPIGLVALAATPRLVPESRAEVRRRLDIPGAVLAAVGLKAVLLLLAVAVAEVGTTGALVALVPGLILTGAGIGLCFTPLTQTVLANVNPARVGSASGAMATTQQMGYALGVAVTGVIFFGAADDGIGHAFELSLIQLAVVSAGIVVMSRLLPAVEPEARGHKTNVTQGQQMADTVVDTAWSTPG